MENELPGIEITVSGEPDSGKTLVCNVINSALTDAGFTNVALVDNHGEPIPAYEHRTYLDLARQGRPELFTTPITIAETTSIPEEEDLGLGDVDEPGEAEAPVADEVVLVQNLNAIENTEMIEA